MTEVVDNILNQLNKVGETVVDKSGKYFKKAVDKGEELTRKGRIQLDIEKAKRELKSKYTEMGEFIYQHHNSASRRSVVKTEEYLLLVTEINQLRQRISEREMEKQTVKTPVEEGVNTKETTE